MSDGLKQVGKFLNDSRQKTDHALKNYSQNFPMIERAVDILENANDFSLFFETFNSANGVFLDITFGVS